MIDGYRPLITIIIATYNPGLKLKRCLSSVFNQTYRSFEIIVIDGGSTDNTVQLISSSHKHINYWESKKDRGIYHAWNKGLQRASGEWVCFLGADDYLCEDSVLERLVPYLNHATHDDIKIVYGQVAIVDAQNSIKVVRGKPWNSIGWQIHHGMPIEFPHTGMMHHRSLFDNSGKFDESFRIAGDYEFLLRYLKVSGRNALFSGGICVAVREEGGVSEINKLAAIKEVAVAKRKNDIYPYSYLWILVYIRAFVLVRLKRVFSKIWG